MLSCGSRAPDTNSPQIGVPLQTAYSIYTGTAGSSFNQNEAVFIDSYSRTIVIFQVDPFAVLQSIKLPDGVNAESFIAGPENQFFVLKEHFGFGILKRDGQYHRNPVPMYGSLTSVSYDAAGQRLILQDDLDSVALVALDSSGTVASSWLGGPIIDGVSSIVAGTLLENGTLLVSLSNQSLATIDFDATVANEKWEYSTFELPIDDRLLWFSPVFNLEPVVIARTERTILTIDVTQKKIIDSIALHEDERAKHFDRSVGHVIVNGPSQNTDLVYSNEAGKLVRTLLRASHVQLPLVSSIDFSVLDQENQNLTIMVDAAAGRSILRTRLSDGLFVGGFSVGNFERSIITKDYVIEVLRYRLGKAVRRSFSNLADQVELIAYNLKSELGVSGR